MKAKNRNRIAVVALLTSLAAGAVIATATLSPAKVPASLPKAEVRAPMVGVPTGEMVNGVPVYRLPSVTGSVSRSEELARIAREEQLAASNAK